MGSRMASKKKEYFSDGFYQFRSDLHHRIKKDELKTMLYIIENNLVAYYWENDNPLFSLYALALLDYLSEKNEIPYVKEYDNYRKKKLEKPFWVKDVAFLNDMEEEKKNALYPFTRYNIFEGDLYDSV